MFYERRDLVFSRIVEAKFHYIVYKHSYMETKTTPEEIGHQLIIIDLKKRKIDKTQYIYTSGLIEIFDTIFRHMIKEFF